MADKAISEQTIPAARFDSNGKCVWLVEDNAELAQQLAEQIRFYGYAVEVLLTPAKFKQALTVGRPDAILLDVAFSDQDLGGPMLVQELWATAARKPPVIFVSERNDLFSRLAAARAGGVAYFTKPVKLDALLERLNMLLATRAPENYNILIVEPDAAQAAHYSELLQRAGMTTVVVSDPAQVLNLLEDHPPDLILMDMNLPGCTGLELATVLRQQDAQLQIPIVFVSKELHPEEQLAAISLGVDDFLTQPVHADHLLSSVTSRAYRSHLLRSFIVRDSLTGLLNHTAFKEQFDIEVARARRQQTPLTLAMIDLDHFKEVNDTYGHPVGDTVLKSLARLLQQRLRKTDVIGRYGGEEFAVALPDTGLDAGRHVLDEIRTGFAQLRLTSTDKAFSVTLSAGLADFPVYQTATDIIDAADKALYEAKRRGRNRVEIA